MAKREMVLSLSEMVKHLLRAHDVPFEVWDRSDYLTILHAVVASGFGGGGQLARVVFLRDEAGLVMALLSDPEDTGVPARRLGRDLVPTLPFEVLEAGEEAAELWVAPEFRNADSLILDVGSGQEVIQVNRDLLEAGFRDSDEDEVTELQVYELLARIALDSPNPEPLWDLVERLHDLEELPDAAPYTEAALGLFLLPEPQPEELLSLVAAQVLERPGYPQPDPVLQRVTRLMEEDGADPRRWEEAMHLTLGHALVRQFPIAAGDRLGVPWCWRHLLLAARVSGHLARLTAVPGVDPRRAALAGWLHDVGHLYMAQVFPREFAIFNHLLELHPHRSVEDMELHLLGLTHTHLGAALAHHWGLEADIVGAIRDHHQLDAEIHNPYAELVLMADRLIHRTERSDAASPILPPWLLRRHGLDGEQLGRVLDEARHGLMALEPAWAEQA